MTREAKIGMLTGLGVIVLIGVLLSEYLGDASAAAAAGGNGATGQMAPLPIGAAYRAQVMEPVSVGIPAMARTSAGETMPVAGPLAAAPLGVDTRSGAGQAAEAQRAVAPGGPATGGPTMGQPVTAVAVGPSPLQQQVASTGGMGPSTITLSPRPPVEPAAQVAPATVVDTAASGSTTVFVIAERDTLAKIARKFYGSAKNSDVQRIIAANPAMLKDAGSLLTVGKKLTIPNVPAADGVRPQAPAAVTAADKRTDVVVYIPGSPPTVTGAKVGTTDSPKLLVAPKTKVYVVQSGDTLEKIARKIAPANVKDAVQRMQADNGIKDPTGLQIGMKLKVPA